MGVSEGFDLNKTSASKGSILFVTVSIFLKKDLGFNQLSVTAVIMY